MALVTGQVDEAAGFFSLALASAERDGDYATVGKCSNNLGIINSLRGLHAQAVGSYTMALAAFQQAHMNKGVAEVHHNLGITYREQRDLERALENANHAVEVATACGDSALSAVARRGRAEVRLLSGDSVSARRELEYAIAVHHDLGDVVQEAENQRVMATVLLAEGFVDQAEELLREVTTQGDALGRPQLSADAFRDLAHLLRNSNRDGEAREAAHAARALFSQLGAVVELQKLDEFLEHAAS
jgi:tetratricopeptide (TPR) repeat protein